MSTSPHHPNLNHPITAILVPSHPSIVRQKTCVVHIPEQNRTLKFHLVSTSACKIAFGEELPPLETVLLNTDCTEFVYHERVELDHLLTATFELIPNTTPKGENHA